MYELAGRYVFDAQEALDLNIVIFCQEPVVEVVASETLRVHLEQRTRLLLKIADNLDANEPRLINREPQTAKVQRFRRTAYAAQLMINPDRLDVGAVTEAAASFLTNPGETA